MPRILNRDALILAVERILRIVVGFGLTILVARHLGVETFGHLGYAMAVVGICSGFASLGLEGVVLRALVEDPAAARPVLGTAVVLRGIAGLVAAGIAITAGMLLDQGSGQLAPAVALMCIALPCSGLEGAEAQLQARGALATGAWYRIGGIAILALVRIHGLLEGAGLLYFAACTAGDLLANGLANTLAIRRSGPLDPGPWWDQVRARTMLRESWPLAVSGQVIVIYMRLSVVLLGTFLGMSAVGLFSLAQRFAEAWLVFPGSLITARSAALMAGVSGGGGDHAPFIRLYREVFAISLGLGGITSIICWWLIPWVFGPAYAPARVLVPILGLATAFSALGMARSTFLSAFRLNHLHLPTTVLGCVASLLAFAAFTPLLGVAGAGLANVVGYSMATLGACLLIPALRPCGRDQWQAIRTAVTRPRTLLEHPVP